MQTANPILILICIPLTNYVIYPAIDRVFPLTPLRKIGIGLFLTAFSFVVIVWIQSQIDHGFEAEHQLAIARLRHPDVGRDDGLNHRPRVFLHPGAEFDEELGHGALVVIHRHRRIFRREIQRLGS